MKIVVFGPDKRCGVLRGDDVVDISGAYAKLIHERDGERHPLELANAPVPADLERFIAGGDATLDHPGPRSTICRAVPPTRTAPTASNWFTRANR